MKRYIPVLILLAACGGGGGGEGHAVTPGDGPGDGPNMGNGTVLFSYSPIATNELTRIVPLGNLNPPGHTLPTDHMYFYKHYHDDLPHPDPNDKFTVYAPASGYIQSIIQPEGDYKVFIKCTNTFYYYLNHILPGQGIVQGVSVAAGQAIGTSSGPHGIDFGAVNTDVTLSFVQPGRYYWQTLHTVSPLEYYVDPLRSTLLSKVLRDGADKNGKITYDQAGTLAGNWFLEGLPIDQGDSPDGWTQQVAFVYDVKDPSLFRISIGGQLTMVGAFAAPSSPRKPEEVTPVFPMTPYPLYNRMGLMEQPTLSGDPLGWIYVRMLDGARVQLETFRIQDYPNGPPGDFTAAAKIYVR